MLGKTREFNQSESEKKQDLFNKVIYLHKLWNNKISTGTCTQI